MKLCISFISIVLSTVIISCRQNHSAEIKDDVAELDSVASPTSEVDCAVNDTIDSDSIKVEFDQYDRPIYLNHVAGHDERQEIVGNFTGQGMDTLRVERREIIGGDDAAGFDCKYFVVSSNPNIPKIEIFGCAADMPLLVYEGDVDGDGRDEWGYLYTWYTSQWRDYKIFNYNPARKKWRYLYVDENARGFDGLLDISLLFRCSGVEIVEKGPRPGLIKINYMTQGVDPQLRDTIVAPTYTPIK